MNLDNLSNVVFGDTDGLREMLFENAMQHQLFFNTLQDSGILIPHYPLADADFDELDDWLLNHFVEHDALANRLSLENPFDLFDTDWNQEDDFYEWIQGHLLIHQAIINRLGL
jgi:hypothetical protein